MTVTIIVSLGTLAGFAVKPDSASAAAPSRASTTAWAAKVLQTMNAERVHHGRAPLLARAKLISIAHAHNVKMAAYNRSSHQLPGELLTTTRIARAGYLRTTAGENVAQTRNVTWVGAYVAQRAMYTENSPTDGSRENILNPAFRYVGVDVYYDAAHVKLWVTEDFSTTAPPATVSMANSMLSTLNAERASHGLPALRMSAKLIRSAHGHNLRMASANMMSHLLPGELSFLGRLLQVGYSPRAAGENIAWNSDRSLAGVLYLQRIMYNEVPPNDGHRRNILNRSFREAGIDVYLDQAHGKVWITQDLGLAA